MLYMIIQQKKKMWETSRFKDKQTSNESVNTANGEPFPTWVREETICSLGKISALASWGAAKRAKRGKIAVVGSDRVLAGVNWWDLEDVLTLEGIRMVLGGGESGGDCGRDGGRAVDEALRAITFCLVPPLSEFWLVWICLEKWVMRNGKCLNGRWGAVIRRGSYIRWSNEVTPRGD